MSEQVNLQEALVKKAAFGNDIDLEKFDDNNEQHVQSTAELSAAGKERLEHVGIDLERENRSASFIQVDNAPIEAEVKPQLPLELMNTGAAAKKYPELVKKYWWNAVKADTDKYTAKTGIFYQSQSRAEDRSSAAGLRFYRSRGAAAACS